MKKFLFFLICLLISGSISFGQTKPNPKQPAQKIVDRKTKALQNELDFEPTAEEIREMEKLGFKMPQLTAQQKKVALDDNKMIVPKKDAVRISDALSVTITNDGMAAYIEKINGLVNNKLNPETKANAAEIFQMLNQKSAYPDATGQAAVGIWMEGHTAIALYILGNTCKTFPSADNLNNYAALLVMCGAEQLAIPMLNNLNKKFPKNSSIYNNLGQAWFGLGDMDRATKYIDSAIRIYAFHPTANFTKCLIEESKGNKTEAVEAGKRSIKRGFSLAKANKLEKLGYKLKSEDLEWDAPIEKDMLGLKNFKWPDYPKNVGESKLLEPQWNEFKQACNIKIEELKAQLNEVEDEMHNQQQIRSEKLLKAGQTGERGSLFPEMASKAFVKLDYLIQGSGASTKSGVAELLNNLILASTKIDELEMVEDEEIGALNEKYKVLFGEGKENPFTAHCNDENNIRNNFLSNANNNMEQKANDLLNYLNKQLNSQLYYDKYTKWPDEYAYTALMAQIQWLGLLAVQKVMFRKESASCRYAAKKDTAKAKAGELQHFDDVACKYISTMDLGCYTITSQCSRLIGEFSCAGIEINLKRNYETDRTSGSVFVGVSKSADIGKGPISVEAEVTGAIGVEVSENGSTDLVVKAGANANVAGQTIAGVEARAGVLSGPRISGGGMLQNIGK